MTTRQIISLLPGVRSKNKLTRAVALIGYNLVAIALVALWSPHTTKSPATEPLTLESLYATSSGELNDLASVTEVVDGDTIKIEGGKTVRYIGIDTPETVNTKKPIQCFGKQASNRNKELVAGKKVRLEKDVSETDKYGRLLRYVYLDGEMVNKKLVAEGLAYAATFPPDVKYQNELKGLQKIAQVNNLGLWGECNQ